MFNLQSYLSVDKVVELFLEGVPLFFLYALAMAVYGVFVFYFYRQLAMRDILVFDISEYKAKRKHRVIREIVGFILYIIKYAILFPLFSFFWFALLSLFLFMLSKSQSVEVILTVAITIVGSTRLLAYYKEDISREIAKLLPLILLGVFLTDPNFFSFSVFYGHLLKIPSLLNVIGSYLMFVFILEFVLRLAFEVKVLILDDKLEEK